VRSYAEIDGPAAADVETYFKAANADAKTRIKLFRLALVAAVSSFCPPPGALRALLFTDPVRLSGTLYGLYDKDTHIDRSFAMLDDLDARESAGRKSL